MKKNKSELHFRGLPVSGGIGIGKLVVLPNITDVFPDEEVLDRDAERNRLAEAVAVFEAGTKTLVERVRLSVGNNEAAILEAQLIMLRDDSMLGEVEKLVDLGKSAEYAVNTVCEQIKKRFEKIEDKVIRARISDVVDIRIRMITALRGYDFVDFETIEKGTIIVAHDIAPSLACRIVKGTVCGIVTESGSRTSHSAILARAMGIPAVYGIDGICDRIRTGENIILDGDTGEVICSPYEDTLGYYKKISAVSVPDAASEMSALKPAITKDGRSFNVFCNVGTVDDMAGFTESGANGVGLFRTEIFFMECKKEPSEDEQFEYYRRILEKAEGFPVTFRTIDMGGEKLAPWMKHHEEDNPFLGYRGIRYSLGHLSTYRKQLRALLRAGAYGNMRIMLPMLTCIEELRQVKHEIDQIKKDFDKKGIAYGEGIKLGVMIETAAAAMISDILAKECDFFSIGTNDLTQYVMCVDRGNPGVGYLYSVFQPAVLRIIKNVIAAASSAGIPVGMCGEAAGEKLMIPLLLAFGLDDFSVSPGNVCAVKRSIERWSTEDAGRLAKRVMRQETQEKVIELLKKADI